jgi:hypothetical protein
MREGFLQTINRVAGGNNLQFVSFLADLGKRIAEDTVGARSSATGAAPKSAAEVLYPDTPTS